MGLMSRVRGIDFYRKIPRDLTEATLSGAFMSMGAAFLIMFLLFAELRHFMAIQTSTHIVVDRSRDGELLRVNFNLIFPSLSCQFVSVDVADTLGTHRANLTKTVKKTSLDKNMAKMQNVGDMPDVKHDDHDDEKLMEAIAKMEMDQATVTGSVGGVVDKYQDPVIMLDDRNFDEVIKKYPIVLVNFYAPWCPWSRRLAPTWEEAGAELLKSFPVEDSRVRLAKLDCTLADSVCRNHHVQAFPSVRVFRSGHDEVYHGHHHDHEAYVGDRTTQAIVDFAKALVPADSTGGTPPPAIAPGSNPSTIKVGSGTPGCQVEGFVLVKKVPGNLHVSAHSLSHSFDYSVMNMTHIIKHLSFGPVTSGAKADVLRRLHPEALQNAWSDRMKGKVFLSSTTNTTHEHYMDVVLTTVEPVHGPSIDLYEYTHHSDHIMVEDMPMAKFSFDPSPMQVIVKEEPRHYYHFITTLCAIIGGVFTVAGIADSSVFTILRALRKVEIGKMT